jgi:uncharacterized protein YyaL (SSP411 family)
MANRLSHESSPYLLQHQDNPVDWYPWGEEALQKAGAENKPIFLSIGYAACHWCHVMAHESFEDPDTAAFMNEHFVNVKVDREERPDLDNIYMGAVQAMTGQGGWPMSVFLTPAGDPFFGGTYFPPSPRYGMPAFRQVLARIAHLWQEQPADLRQNAREVTNHITRSPALAGEAGLLDEGLFRRALDALARTFDEERGGFGRAPKFPQPMIVEFLLRLAVRTGDERALHMAETTLEMMARGGMYDQLGGGFARYSTDDEWLVPHFEKMLYDNALLARAYLHAWQLTGKADYRRVVEETLDFCLREMAHEQGGFYSSYDADSEGEEGKFYVWSAAEIQEHLGEDADLFGLAYGVTRRGNWEGHNILHLARPLEEVARIGRLPRAEVEAKLATARRKLYDVRAGRVWPGLDDKVLTAWNGLILAALAEAGRALKRQDYVDAACRNAAFLHQNLRAENGRLLRTWKAGAGARYNGYLEDYAYLADGLLELYQTTFDVRWFMWAQELCETMLAHFRDAENGGFYDTSDDHEALIQRPKDLQDNAVPSGNAMAAHVLLRLSLYTGNGDYWDLAQSAVAALYGAMAQYPNGFAHWLSAAAFILGEPQEIAIAGDPGAPDSQALLDVAFAGLRPFQVVAAALPETPAALAIPLLADRPMIASQATAYVCRRFLCQRPVTTPDQLTAHLSGNPVS